MNYLAGFLLLTVADSVMSERADPPASSSSTNGTTTVDTAPTPDGEAVTLEVAQTAAAKDTVAVTKAGQKEAATKAGQKEAEPTAAEEELIEAECVQVMLGMIALQGGVLSRDLWGLHAVSEGEGKGGSWGGILWCVP